VTIQQPLIAPLYDGKSAHELLSVLAGQADRSGHDLVHDHWKGQAAAKDFEIFWETALHAGLVAGSAHPHKNVELKWSPGLDVGQGTPPSPKPQAPSPYPLAPSPQPQTNECNLI
jgi:molybdopterin-containing oxidoreductase family iron-sulfur binding subunit